MMLAGCGSTNHTGAPSTTPGIEAVLRVTITEITREGHSPSGTWNVTFIYGGHVVSAPTVAGVDPRNDLVGKNAIIHGSVGRDGSFVILSVEPADG